MKSYVCDKCETVLKDGPIGAFSFANIAIQPSYEMVRYSQKWHLCPSHADQLETLLMEFVNASED